MSYKMSEFTGKEFKMGDIVKISNAYFANDNGLYFVDNAPGDPSWTGSDYSLHKISKTGKISKAKYNLCFWPICVFTNSYEKRCLAKAWNKEHAEIELSSVKSNGELVEHFKGRANEIGKQIERAEWQWGWGKDERGVETLNAWKKMKRHYEETADRLSA